ncbi:MAG: flavodoxin [Chloroflexi bacterium]|nr:MAG: flavodoxin [Chloroflexota bacterium]
MSAIGLFYGSTDGHTAMVARLLQQAFGACGVTVELFDIADYYLEEMLGFDRLILGAPTWNIGQLQADWEEVLDEFDALDLSGKEVALFGLGDQAGYPDTFVDALFFVANRAQERGARLVGAWPTAGYQFRQSWAVVDEHFLGLVLDEHNQPELTPQRVAAWVTQLLTEFTHLR